MILFLYSANLFGFYCLWFYCQIELQILTLFAHSKHVVTTLLMTFIRFFVSCITWSTLTKVAAFPTVGSFTVNCSVCTYVGTLSKWSSSSFFCCPAGTCKIIILNQNALSIWRIFLIYCFFKTEVLR